MRTFPQTIIEETLKKRGSPWIWAFDIVADVNPTMTPTIPLVGARQEIVLDGQRYYPFPIRISSFGENAQGDIPTFSVSVSNVTRFLPPYLEEGRGFRGMPLTAHFAHSKHLAQGAAFSVVSEVRNAALTDKGLVFECEIPNANDQLVPQDRVNTLSCGYEYGKELCGVLLNAAFAGVYPTCSKTYGACSERGDLEAQLGRARLHPRRWGGWPGANPRVRT